ncbi:MAG: aldo/keto reductase [Desulfarculales bacterium]|jgi:predicted aldo/keto reductase-like oxidoreductase|nr:aldo/keto reductase [Desulfarculales bacterium]
METRSFTSIGREISLLGFGLMRLPLADPGKPEIDYSLGEKMIDLAWRSGVNYFDTAWPYHDGLSELFAGAVLSRYPRESYCLASKMPLWALDSAERAEEIFNRQLEKCRVDYFDFYLLHSLTEEHYKIALDFDIYNLLARKKQQGLIKRLGFSFHDNPGLLARIVSAHSWDFAQIQLNYIDWQALEAKRQYEILAQRQIPVVIMEPVRGGALATLNPQALNILQNADPGASPASWALRYAGSLPGVLTVLSGMSDLEQVKDNIATMEQFKPLSNGERDLLAQAGSAYLASGVIPCTNCRYCMDCPSGVNIPRVFAVYNHYRTIDNSFAPAIFANNYRTLGPSEQAHNCTGCDRCLEYCPQSINIPEQMRTIAALSPAPQPLEL